MKIGIISLYYKNYNYGGLLQAYALTEFLNAHGFETEQISWDFLNGLKRRPAHEEKENGKGAVTSIKKTAGNIIKSLNKRNYDTRRSAFVRFENMIPHSEVVYTYENIRDSVQQYDCFVAGSDQIWNMDWYNPENFLSFVPDVKVKVSYAASMPNTNLSEEQKRTVKNHLERFDAISVREKTTADMLSDLVGRKIDWVLDPTLLLHFEDWERIMSPYKIKGKYIFCFYLSGRQLIRDLANEFSKKVSLPIVTFSDLGGTYLTDVIFGNKKIYDAGPDAFLSLIMNAEYVLTDSFHATVFSNIFKTKFFTFTRDDGKMDSRIMSLLKIFDSEERFCTGAKFNVEYLVSLKDEPVSADTALFLEMKKHSEDYLIDALQKRA